MITGRFELDKELIKRARAAANEACAELSRSVLADCGQFVPMDSGRLLQSGEAGAQSVKYTAEYAQKVYYGDALRFSRQKHSNACARWLEPAKAVSLKKWRAQAAKTLCAGAALALENERGQQ